ncbi:hypothetical protein RvY_13197 [Ramazzottius varieornatus]|uniref:Uncharacterized protein n=1 Tax=Ramazzottius varieornatus TaxID=947166 RepID=A0A1D1VM19_RAMVA|nr:hypothetical protein RvY_13197 [Ramazzottius varieornatus]
MYGTWRKTGCSVFLSVLISTVLFSSLSHGANLDPSDNEIALGSGVGISVKALSSGTGVSSGFWDNTKPGSFERLFIPSNEEYDILSTPQKKKAWFRMYKKAVNARQFRLY